MKQKRRVKKNSNSKKMARASSQKPQEGHAADSDLSPDIKEQLRIAREFMEKYRETFAMLAKT